MGADKFKEKLTRLYVENAKIYKSLPDIRARRGETRTGLAAAAPEALVERVSWAEAVKICPRLGKDHEAAMRAATRQRLPELLEMTQAEYAAQFKFDLPKPEVEAIRDDESSVGLYTPHFDNATKALDVLIKEVGIPLWSGKHCLEHIVELRRADSRDMPAEELAELRAMRWATDAKKSRALALFQAAREVAVSRPYSPASVLYAANQQEAPVANKSALDVIGRGQFLNGAANFMFIRQVLDRGMIQELKLENLDNLSPEDYQTKFAELFKEGRFDKYMPDTRGWTVSPTDVFENGGVLRSRWGPGGRKLYVSDANPDYAYDLFGFRPARGGAAS